MDPKVETKECRVFPDPFWTTFLVEMWSFYKTTEAAKTNSIVIV